MKKRSVLMLVFAFIGTLAMGAGCSFLPSKDSQEEASSKESSVAMESSETIESSEEIVSSEEASSEIESSEEASEASSEESSEEETIECKVTITSPEGEVFPYVDAAKNYLQAGVGALIDDYYVQGLEDAQVPVQIKWQFEGEGQRKFRVEYATKADYSDAIVVDMGAAKRSMEVYNLYKATKYYLRITALGAKDAVLSVSESEFETTALGPRVMNVDGVDNVRDLGGFETCFGKTIVQGIAYRGGSLTTLPDNLYSPALTDEGKRVMSEELGIVAELDFRNESETGNKVEDGSAIPGATLTYLTAGGYEDLFISDYNRGVYKDIFVYLSNKDNYPLYYHCTAGADRTGTVSFMLHALLGVSEWECIQDYEFTSFSSYGLRGGEKGANASRFNQMLTYLKEYRGETFQEKAENYFLDIGVTAEQIANIKGIFFGEIAIGGKDAPDVQEAPIVRNVEKKTLKDMFDETAQGWTIQKKED